MRRVAFAGCLCLILSIRPAFSDGFNRRYKVAVHILPHSDTRQCGSKPARDLGIIDCEDIVTTYMSVGDLDIFPVFYDLDEYESVRYGLAWPSLQPCAFTSCSDYQIGDIINTGDGIEQFWDDWKRGPICIPGWAWVTVSEAGPVCVVPHPTKGGILAWMGGYFDQPVYECCAGVGGWPGEEACTDLAKAARVHIRDNVPGDCIVGGHYLTYTVTVENTSSDLWITSVYLQVYFSEWLGPAGVTAKDYDAAGGGVSDWITRDIAPGSRDSLRIHARVSSEAPAGEYVSAHFKADINGEVFKQARESTMVCVDLYTPLTLDKDGGLNGSGIVAGGHMVYTIGYGNTTNPVEMHNVTITDRLPWNLRFISASDGGSFHQSEGTVTWNLGTIGAGEVGQVQLETAIWDYMLSGYSFTNFCEIMSDETRPTEAQVATQVTGALAQLVALHVLPCEGERSCEDLPLPLTGCEDIVTQTDVCGCIHVFPVFLDIPDYTGFAYSLNWPSQWGDMAFTSCADVTVGDIAEPGDLIEQSWVTCQSGPWAIPGFGQVDADSPGRIWIHNDQDDIIVEDCWGGGTFCPDFRAGVCGMDGDQLSCDDLPEPSTVPTTWSGIKAMFR